jgi:uncharacterized protein
MRMRALIEGIAVEVRSSIRKLDLFDANLWLGEPDHFPLATPITPDALGRALDEYDIRGGLVSHWDGIRLSPQDGNQALLDAEAALPPSVWTVWVGLPLAPGEQGSLPATQPMHRVRGVRLFPRSHHFQLSPWVVGGLCEWCAEHGLPIFVWHTELEWEQLHALATAFPGVTIVVDTQWQKILYHSRDLFSLLDASGNVLVESSNLIGQDFVAWVVRHWGAERILYGSFLPVNDPYSAIGMILDADISEAEKALIAGGNARRILGAVRL